MPQRYRTIVADPPWEVGRGPEWASNGPSRPLTYPTMTVEEIAALPVAGLAERRAHLYLWTVNAFVEDAYEVARHWGFRPSTLLTWCKRPHGIGLGGAYVLTTEHVLFARRGVLPASERIPTNWWEMAQGRAQRQARGVPRPRGACLAGPACRAIRPAQPSRLGHLGG